MNKLYERIDFVNDTTPALNDSNLNLMSKAIDDIDDRVIEVSDDIMVVVPQIQEMLQSAEALVTEAEASANSASISADNAEHFAEEAAAGSGGNNLAYADEMLQLKRDNVVLSAVHISGGGGGGTSNYNDLSNKPSINNVELVGNKTLEALGIEQLDVLGSDAYNPSTSYNVGDCCIYDNALYKNIVACSNVLPTDSTYWEKVTLAQVNNDLFEKSNALMVKGFTHVFSITANGSVNWNPYDDGIDIDGYTILGIVAFSVGRWEIVPITIDVTNNEYGMFLSNRTSTARNNVSASYKVLYVKN